MTNTRKTSPRLLTWLVAGTLLSGTTIAAHASSSCVGLSACDRSICEKESELEKAKEYGDVSKILGIQNSLVHLKNSCSQNPDIRREKYEEKLAELKAEYKEDLNDALDEYEDDLAEAKSDGKPEKIQRAKDKHEQKVRKATDEYESKLKLLQATK